MAMVCCNLCTKIEARYKCAKCKIPYCSIVCYKTHQLSNCEPIIEIKKVTTDSNYNHVSYDTVPVERLKMLDNNKELQSILKNPHVRDILLEIDKSKNAAAIMEKAMREPIFVEFADTCLKTVEDSK